MDERLKNYFEEKTIIVSPRYKIFIITFNNFRIHSSIFRWKLLQCIILRKFSKIWSYLWFPTLICERCQYWQWSGNPINDLTPQNIIKAIQNVFDLIWCIINNNSNIEEELENWKTEIRAMNSANVQLFIPLVFFFLAPLHALGQQT